jgi:hypothetical protein
MSITLLYARARERDDLRCFGCGEQLGDQGASRMQPTARIGFVNRGREAFLLSLTSTGFSAIWRCEAQNGDLENLQLAPRSGG